MEVATEETRKLWGERVRKARTGRFTQEQFAEALGVTQQTVSRIETGKQGVTLGMAIAIADLLNTTADELFAAGEKAAS